MFFCLKKSHWLQAYINQWCKLKEVLNTSTRSGCNLVVEGNWIPCIPSSGILSSSVADYQIYETGLQQQLRLKQVSKNVCIC